MFHVKHKNKYKRICFTWNISSNNSISSRMTADERQSLRHGCAVPPPFTQGRHWINVGMFHVKHPTVTPRTNKGQRGVARRCAIKIVDFDGPVASDLKTLRVSNLMQRCPSVGNQTKHPPPTQTRRRCAYAPPSRCGQARQQLSAGTARVMEMLVFCRVSLGESRCNGRVILL